MDLVIAIDVSGSMQDDIDAVKNSSQEILKAIFGDGEDSRVGILTFNDTGSIQGVLPFTQDERAAEAGVQSLSILGGGEEPLNGALIYALDGGLGLWRADDQVDVRRIIVFSYEPPADPELAAQVQEKAKNPAVEGGDANGTDKPVQINGFSVTKTMAMAADADGILKPVEIFTVIVGNDQAAVDALFGGPVRVDDTIELSDDGGVL